MGARKRYPRGRDWTSIREAGYEARKPPIQSGRSLTCAAKTKYSLTRERIEGMADPPLWNTSLAGLRSLTKMVRCLSKKTSSSTTVEMLYGSSSSHRQDAPGGECTSKVANTQDRNVGTLHRLARVVDQARRFQPMSCGGRWSKKPMLGVMPRIC